MKGIRCTYALCIQILDSLAVSLSYSNLKSFLMVWKCLSVWVISLFSVSIHFFNVFLKLLRDMLLYVQCIFHAASVLLFFFSLMKVLLDFNFHMPSHTLSLHGRWKISLKFFVVLFGFQPKTFCLGTVFLQPIIVERFLLLLRWQKFKSIVRPYCSTLIKRGKSD